MPDYNCSILDGTCEICGDHFTSQAGLKKHLKNHAGILDPTTWTFTIGFILSIEWSYFWYILMAFKEKLTTVISTGLVIVVYDTVHTHCTAQKQRFRLDVRPFHIFVFILGKNLKHKCHFCDKAFAFNTCLKMHIRTHTGNKYLFCVLKY